MTTSADLLLIFLLYWDKFFLNRPWLQDSYNILFSICCIKDHSHIQGFESWLGWKNEDRMLPSPQASAAEPRFAAAAVWPSPAARTAWAPHADSPPTHTHTQHKHTHTHIQTGEKVKRDQGIKISRIGAFLVFTAILELIYKRVRVEKRIWRKSYIS